MKLKWQWFSGGQGMFWVSIILLGILISGFVTTYLIDPVSATSMKKQSIDVTSIKEISEKYVASYGIEIDKPIVYRFVRYNDEGYEAESGDEILLGTFHEWNNTYYIDISVDLYKMSSLDSTVIHETRHMIVNYLKDKRIIDLTKYTEEIADETNSYYNNMFNSGIYLLKKSQINKEK